MPRMNRFILPLILILSASTSLAQALPASGILLDSYAAIVNGKVITVGDVLAVLQPVQERLATQYDGNELEQKILEEYDVVRDNLIESELILLDFEMQGGTLPDRAVEDHVNSVIHDKFQNDRTAFLKALAAERLTFAEWRKQMKDQLIVQIMRQKEVSSKILITPLDMQKAYDARRDAYSLPERVRLRTLDFGRGDTKKERQDIREKAEAHRGRLLAGEGAFETSAPEGAALQDDLEFIDSASLNETLRAAIAGLAPGDISGPVEIGDHLYLVQLVERQEARVRPFNEVAPQIEKEIRKAEFERLNKVWIDSLRSKYYIQVFAHNLFS